MSTSCRNSSMIKWRRCSFLVSVRRSPSLLKNMVSRLKALSRVSYTERLRSSSFGMSWQTNKIHIVSCSRAKSMAHASMSNHGFPSQVADTPFRGASPLAARCKCRLQDMAKIVDHDFHVDLSMGGMPCWFLPPATQQPPASHL